MRRFGAAPLPLLLQRLPFQPFGGRYSEELTKLVCDEHYRKSLLLEPRPPDAAVAGGARSLPFRLKEGGRGHRKSRSLGTGASFFPCGDGLERAAVLGGRQARTERGRSSALEILSKHLFREPMDDSAGSDASSAWSAGSDDSDGEEGAPVEVPGAVEGVLHLRPRGYHPLRRRYCRHWGILNAGVLRCYRRRRGDAAVRAHFRPQCSDTFRLEGAAVHRRERELKVDVTLPGGSPRFTLRTASPEEWLRWAEALERAAGGLQPACDAVELSSSLPETRIRRQSLDVPATPRQTSTPLSPLGRSQSSSVDALVVLNPFNPGE